MSRSECLIGPERVGLRSPRRIGPNNEPSIARGRARRVTVLLLASVALSGLDLAFTLTYASSSIGLIELNPLARVMIAVGGAGELIRFKLFSIALSAGSLYLIRRSRGAELGAWVCLGVLVLLSLHWVRYTEAQALAHINTLKLTEAMASDHRWVAITE